MPITPRNRLHVLALAASVTASAFVLACAVGAQTADADGGVSTDGDDSGAGGSKRDTHHTAFDDDSGGPSPPDTRDGGAARDGGGDAEDGGSIPASCTVPNTCPTAMSMGVVSGDTLAETQSATGITAKWLSVRVGENDHRTLVGRKLSLKVDLASPPGVNFDLFVYVNEGTDVVECTTATGSSTSTTSADTASITWGEGAIPNGKDDSRTVSIEVRYVSGTCDPSAKWTLNVAGNQ